MRLRNLLLVSALVLSFTLAALAQRPAEETDVALDGPAASTPNQTEMARLPLRRTLDLPKDERVCLKLRTYVVRRVNPESDVTRLHSYSTCQPAWKFDTRNAVVPDASADQRFTY